MHLGMPSRTPSATSSMSDDVSQAVEADAHSMSIDSSRRTRKRFSSTQIMMLEDLFHRTSHPTREERETVAHAADMEVKSVTIWFQNKRQTERRVALHSHCNTTPHPNHPASSGIPPRAPRGAAVRQHPSNASVSSSSSSSHFTRSHRRSNSLNLITPSRPRLSLDRVASRSELRVTVSRTPAKARDPTKSLWDNMPSSPLAPPVSPPAHEYLEFVGDTRRGRTLEWACAAARIAEKEEKNTLLSAHKNLSMRSHFPKAQSTADGKIGVLRECDGEEEDTEDEDLEVITPDSSFGATQISWGRTQGKPGLVSKEAIKIAVQDEDVMRAALALCGLGRR